MGSNDLSYKERDRRLFDCSSMTGLFARKGCKLLFCFVTFLPLVCAVSPAWAEKIKTVVWYPELTKPYSNVFDEILLGILSNSKAPTVTIPLDAGSSVTTLRYQSGEPLINPVIVLGQQAIQLAGKFDQSYRFVAGATYHPPIQDNFVFISYHPSPKYVYRHLKLLFPDIVSLYVVFGPTSNQWLKSVALEEAQAEGINLKHFEAHSLRESAQIIRGITQGIDAEREAVWIIPDQSVIDDKVIVPYLLSEAWKKNVVVISNSLAHVDRGMLFALYPDNVRLGEKMADISRQIASDRYKGPKVQALDELKYAINVRTAKHLGLELDQARLKRYDLVFPQR